jgi:hypothetical protein
MPAINIVQNIKAGPSACRAAFLTQGKVLLISTAKAIAQKRAKTVYCVCIFHVVICSSDIYEGSSASLAVER